MTTLGITQWHPQSDDIEHQAFDSSQPYSDTTIWSEDTFNQSHPSNPLLSTMMFNLPGSNGSVAPQAMGSHTEHISLAAISGHNVPPRPSIFPLTVEGPQSLFPQMPHAIYNSLPYHSIPRRDGVPPNFDAQVQALASGAYIDESLPSPATSRTASVSASGDSLPGPRHDYLPIASSIDHKTLDEWLEPCMLHGVKAHRCAWPECSKKPFPRKSSAYAHVRSHLTPVKAFGCIVCSTQFSTESTAKRHRDNQGKMYSCGLCHKKFCRKDYRKTHQIKCNASNYRSQL